MCIDYTDLNKACPKDSFPLPRIDQLVDTTSGHQMLSFMDAYSGYNQIKMNQTDEEATAFQTDRGLYCYRVMPFRLKNAGATYQRLMNKVFKTLIGHNMEVYVDDMLVKSLEKSQHISNLEQCFRLLRRYNMRLNPTKCTFGVASGKFPGFMVTHRGIEANPEKIMALRDMVPPKNIKEVQRLNGRIAALSRFLARSGDKYLPFFKILRGARNFGFQWTDECQEAFEQLRKYLASPPLLSKPTSGEKLYLYIAVSTQAISSVLVREENATQRPVYYVSKILSEMEGRYPLADKTALALVYSARKLRPYFQAHSIGVYTNLPLKCILQKSEASGRLVKWSVELGEFDIHYLPRPDIKSQALADFVVECTVHASDIQTGTLPSPPRWTLYVDGSSEGSGAGAGILLISPQEVTLEYGLRLKFPATNNMAEYEALIAGIKLAIDCKVQNLVVHTDSQLVAFQVEGEFEIHNP
ncbi:RNA-directed DNA polymerase [Dendrobium catenatum]|uniref:RNA-directed DNA polymerase n=1 Tax=Dendrobium catenatum TaxID=906689 RepID=A0A2I0XCX6_9ASPA|nr:RNA-directed DNA polymerase [Dendrobium catenatum]